MNDKKEKLGAFPFVIGGLSFIPGLGILFGVISITWGLATNKARGKLLALIGGGGILLNIILYSSLFYRGFIKRGGVYDNLRVELAKSSITELVLAIEFYKVQNGKYPESLEILRKSLPKNSTVFVFDPTDVQIVRKTRYFHYELVDNQHYYLLGVGPDGQPFTRDDILPEVEVGPDSKIGLLIKTR